MLGVLQRRDLLVNGGCLLVPCFLRLFQLFVNGIFQFVPKILLQLLDLLGDLPVLRGQGVDVRLTGPDPPHILRLCVERRLDLPHLVDLVRRAVPTLLHEGKLRLPQGYDVLQPFQLRVLSGFPCGRCGGGRIHFGGGIHRPAVPPGVRKHGLVDPVQNDGTGFVISLGLSGLQQALDGPLYILRLGGTDHAHGIGGRPGLGGQLPQRPDLLTQVQLFLVQNDHPLHQIVNLVPGLPRLPLYFQ